MAFCKSNSRRNGAKSRPDELQRAQQHLAASQKIESGSQISGGIAHDFLIIF